MYVNIMDYSDDADYACFTPNQVTRMQAAVGTYLSSVAAGSSTLCAPPTPQAPVAAFTANAVTVSVGTTVTFTDQSTNTPTSWAWTFAGGSPASSTTQNPSITYNTAGTYSVTLAATNSIGSDSETKTNYITVVAGGVSICDTLHYPLVGTTPDPPYTGDSGGYVAGNNGYEDKAKADYFASYPPNTDITDVILNFSVVMHASASTVTVNIWNNGGASGSPGTVIGTTTIPYSSIVANTPITAHFATPVNITGPFYAGVILPTTAGDTLALNTNTDGDVTPGTAWEQFSDNSWHAMSETPASWNLNLQLAVHPIVCTPVGIEESLINNIQVYPNPANDVLNIDFADYSNSNISVKIFNSIGELVKSVENKTMSPMMIINLSDVNSGMYYITINSDGGSITKKITIMK